MSFTHPRFLLLLVTALLTTATPATAENRQGAFTVSPFAGGQGFPFGGETHYDADFNWGARAGYNISPNWRAELVFGVNDTVHDPEAAWCTMYQYGADVLYAFRPDKRLVPFLAAGFGAFDVNYTGGYHSKGDPTVPVSDETSAYFNFGGGIEYALTRWLALRADFRHAIMLNSGDSALQGSLGITLKF
ncbi:MAG TPA: outer membrane beta-barrel protein [Verrucomicrobiota bacterium]|nr:outer membrane beta-barrel protein [Verrucomicrobiota bacterium]